MRVLAVAALLLASCAAPPSTDVAVSGEPVTESIAYGRPAPSWPSDLPPLPPRTTTTTTTTVPRVAPAAAVSVSRSRPASISAESSCGGWRSLVASFFPAHEVNTACRIIGCETGHTFNAAEVGGPNKNGTYDVGLFQINDVHGHTVAWRQDPTNNVSFAASLHVRNGWRPWTCARILGIA